MNAIATHDFLVEIGTAELPPKALKKLALAFQQGIASGLKEARLKHGELQLFATPRRLSVMVNALSTQQADQEVERRGPPLKVAYKDGVPTKAAEKFAAANGVSVTELGTLETGKGEYLVYRGTENGAATTALIPDIVQQALDALPIAKRMRWGNQDTEFVRPVYWIVMLHGADVINCKLFGIQASNVSRGHRFSGEKEIAIQRPSAYKNLLEHAGGVMVDFSQRRDLISQQAKESAESVSGTALIDNELLDEVTALVEMPSPILGEFDRRFLQLPREVLISTLQEHQKYFPVVDHDNQLLPYFITISNIKSTEPEQVKKGNERVISPRLADAEFFWKSDLKTPLADRFSKLEKVVFQYDLGSIADKSKRVAKLAHYIASKIGADTTSVERAAHLAKCDLVTDMVGEFPDLQGIMGSYYAQLTGESPEVASAIRSHYLPKFSGDELPSDAVSQALSLADKLDTITGIFAIGKKPSGTRDPFGLRRLSIGVLRIIAESNLNVDMHDLVTFAKDTLPPTAIKADDTVADVMNYINERNKFMLTEQGFSYDQINAVLASGSTNPLDLSERLEAIKEFISMPAAPNLAAANKRVSNILKKNHAQLADLPKVDVNKMTEKAEYNLYQALQPLHSEINGLLKANRYKDILIRLAHLREPIDAFFDEVMVMSEVEVERNNRLNILIDFKQLSSSVADLSELKFE